ncbi:hypothetical protein ACKUT9_14040 [Mycobacterium seoulense]|uniref:hypothetical protein n=1 Tax=Mycobacterium seoulense TaxID=386911 RepID=UPI003CED8120
MAALEPLENAEIEADIENPALPPDATSTMRLRTDLLIRALDLRIRLSLLPGAEATELDANEVLNEGLAMLFTNPETAAVVVVADDDDLTCRIIEPFDTPDAVLSADAWATDASLPRRGPATIVLRAYLRQINPSWDPPPRIGQISHEIDSVALQVAQDVVAKLQARRKKTPEWREARQGLTVEDAQWVRDQAIDIVLGESGIEALASRLEERSRNNS